MNWYKKIKFANQYGVIDAYGFWIDPEGQILNVNEIQLHKGALEQSGWLHPNWRQNYGHAYAAAADYNFIRVAIEYDPINQDNSIMFDGCGGENPLTLEQKRIIHDMFLEFKRHDRHGKAYIDCIAEVPYRRVHTVQEMDKLLQQMPMQVSSSNHNVKIAKREFIIIKRFNEDTVIDYLVNPTRNEIIGFLNTTRGPEAKGVFIDGNLYVWDAFYCNHCKFCRAIGGGCENMKCYGDEPQEFSHDALVFRLDNQGELITNIPYQHENIEYFHGGLEPYNDPRESGDDFDFWTHKWGTRDELV